MSGPDVWGPYGWKFIHYITLGYPPNPSEYDKKIYYDFFIQLAKVIPCSICGAHFTKNMEITPLTPEALKNRESLVAWGIEMHNHVNRMHNKKTYNFAEGLQAILKDELGECKKMNTTPSVATKPTVIIEKFENHTKLYYSLVLNIILIIAIVYLLYK
jgi:hypothetical protein